MVAGAAWPPRRRGLWVAHDADGMNLKHTTTSTRGHNNTMSALDNDTDPKGVGWRARRLLTARTRAELMERNLESVRFHFDDEEEALRGCTKLKKHHDECFTSWYQTHYVTRSGVGLEMCSKQTALYQKCLQVRWAGAGVRTVLLVGDPPRVWGVDARSSVDLVVFSS